MEAIDVFIVVGLVIAAPLAIAGILLLIIIGDGI